MKNFKFIITVLLLICLILNISACSDKHLKDENSSVTEVEKLAQLNLSIKEYTTGVKGTFKLKYHIENVKKIIFESSDSEIATVDEKGIVKGINYGNTTITLTAQPDDDTVNKGEIKKKCYVNVNNGSLNLKDDDKNLNWVGRNFKCDEGMACYNSASGFSLSFYGTELKSCIYSAGSFTPKIAVLIDGNTDYSNEDCIVKLSKQGKNGKEYTLAKGLSEGNHTVRVFKITEPLTTSVIFKNVTTDGYFETKPQKSKYQLEIYGDSITVGHQNMRPQPEEKDVDNIQNALMTYSFLASEKLGADISVFARTGIGVNSSWGSPFVLRTSWFKTYCAENDFLHSKYTNPQWAFNSKIDGVLINIGTNDAWYSWDKNIFEKDLKELIYNFLETYGKDVKIVLIHSVMENIKTPASIKKVYNELKDDGLKNIFCVKLNTSAYGHPRVEDNLINGEILYNALAEIFN